ncbi:hypothetical protein GCK32_007831 [Trichostrongylus colubriformis]|uniref:Uncharacterized protein n=1 Tax=Trichostrongylus colubriformis TaxID=6319 RepID=A0AAN8FZY4_TRICO
MEDTLMVNKRFTKGFADQAGTSTSDFGFISSSPVKEECGLSEERRADLRAYSREKKLVMLNTQTFRPEEDCGKLISLLRAFENEQSELVAPPASTLQDVAITLRTQCSR